MASNQAQRSRSRSRSQDRNSYDRRTTRNRESFTADRNTSGHSRRLGMGTEKDAPRRSRSPLRSRRRSRSRSRSPRHKRQWPRSRSHSRGPERSHSWERHERPKGREKHRHKRSRSRSSSASSLSDTDSERRRRKKKDKHRSRDEKRERKREKKEKKVSSLMNYNHRRTRFLQKKRHGTASGAQWGKYGIISETESVQLQQPRPCVLICSLAFTTKPKNSARGFWKSAKSTRRPYPRTRSAKNSLFLLKIITLVRGIR